VPTPNIVCVSLDSVRADFCSFSDSGRQTTPFLRSLASEGTVFESAISPSVWTLPVHTSVFTGLYPPEHGVTSEGNVLGDHPTFAELLSQEGYSTAAFFSNSWLRVGDVLRGFQASTPDSNSDSDPSVKAKVVGTIDSFSSTAGNVLRSVYKSQMFYRQWRTTEKAKSGIDKGGERTINDTLAALKAVDDPFCWFVHLDEAHWPYTPPNPYHRLFTDRNTASLAINGAYWQQRTYDSQANRLKTITGERSPPKREVATFRDLYRGGIRYCDDLISRLVTGLREAGVWNNTVLIVFGDHGDSFGERGIFGHHFSVDDSVVHVPLFVRDPTGELDPGRVSEPVSLVDVYATIAELADASAPETNSHSLLNGGHEYAYTYYDATEVEHLLNAAKQLGMTPADLPPLRQHAIWKSPAEKSIWYPDSDEWNEPSTGDRSLRSELDRHTERLNPIRTRDEEISNAVSGRLEDMGYL